MANNTVAIFNGIDGDALRLSRDEVYSAASLLWVYREQLRALSTDHIHFETTYISHLDDDQIRMYLPCSFLLDNRYVTIRTVIEGEWLQGGFNVTKACVEAGDGIYVGTFRWLLAGYIRIVADVLQDTGIEVVLMTSPGNTEPPSEQLAGSLRKSLADVMQGSAHVALMQHGSNLVRVSGQNNQLKRMIDNLCVGW